MGHVSRMRMSIVGERDVYCRESELISTYSPIGELSAEELVQQYRQVIEYCADHPNAKSTAVSSALNLPRSRIRAWVDHNGAPDAARAVDEAHWLGWLGALDTERQVHFATLIAGVFSGGSIATELYAPSWTVDNQSVTDALETALQGIGCSVKCRHEPVDHRPAEILPERHGSLLGRVLVCMGAPLGQKATDDDLRVPPRLFDAPEEVRVAFCEVYLRNRLSPTDGRASGPIMEDRPAMYREQLAELFQSVGIDARSAERTVTVRFDSLPFAIEEL